MGLRHAFIGPKCSASTVVLRVVLCGDVRGRGLGRAFVEESHAEYGSFAKASRWSSGGVLICDDCGRVVNTPVPSRRVVIKTTDRLGRCGTISRSSPTTWSGSGELRGFVHGDVVTPSVDEVTVGGVREAGLWFPEHNVTLVTGHRGIDAPLVGGVLDRERHLGPVVGGGLVGVQRGLVVGLAEQQRCATLVVDAPRDDCFELGSGCFERKSISHTTMSSCSMVRHRALITTLPR